jgi:hypothetical protein
MTDQRQFTLRQVDQARTDCALIESNLEFIASQLAKQPTRGDLAKTALGIHLLHRGLHDPVRLDRMALAWRL